mgnify:CR=1 FL=1|jgi:hypothetical protein
MDARTGFGRCFFSAPVSPTRRTFARFDIADDAGSGAP